MRPGSSLPHHVEFDRSKETTVLLALVSDDRPDWSWMHRAACRDKVDSADDDVFFAPDLEDVGGSHQARVSETVRRQRIALATCQRCPVQTECLAGAAARREPHGVWGGQLFINGQVVAHKRPRGRPRKAR